MKRISLLMFSLGMLTGCANAEYAHTCIQRKFPGAKVLGKYQLPVLQESQYIVITSNATYLVYCAGPWVYNDWATNENNIQEIKK